MSWYAKPSGGYGISSTEGSANIREMNGYFNSRGYTLEAQAGIMGNVVGESALNPWRWQGDTYNLGGGYGLFQYTPASGYINGGASAPGYGPNMSPAQITQGARPEDGYAQCVVFADDTLQKWTPYCWRGYWDPSVYSNLYQMRGDILSTYGNGSTLTQAQFAQINRVDYATFAFLACFEGPAVPDYSNRYSNASIIYQMLSGDTPPDPPGPPGPSSPSIPPWLLFRIKWDRSKLI